MKLMLGNTPVKKMMIHNDTQDATMVASDLQSGVTCYAKGQKVTGTGKSFEFAQYGKTYLNFPIVVPSNINVFEVASTDYPIKMLFSINNIKNIDFSSKKDVAKVIIDNEEYMISLLVSGNIMTIYCDKSVSLEVFYGKDNYT